ncbi:Uncharacterized protein APZ42_007424, partial [Daphnia magna]
KFKKLHGPIMNANDLVICKAGHAVVRSLTVLADATYLICMTSSSSDDETGSEEVPSPQSRQCKHTGIESEPNGHSIRIEPDRLPRKPMTGLKKSW